MSDAVGTFKKMRVQTFVVSDNFLTESLRMPAPLAQCQLPTRFYVAGNKFVGTRREPSNSTPAGVTSVSFGSPYLPMGRACDEPNEIKKINTHRKMSPLHRGFL